MTKATAYQCKHGWRGTRLCEQCLYEEVSHLRRGIAAYREFRRRWQEDHTDGHEWVECLHALGLWEREEAKRDAT